MSVKIVVDSAADIAKEYKGQFVTVPLTITFGDKEYQDGVTITHKEFYEKLIESDELPTTSQASPAAFEKEFKKIFEENKDD